jgi:phosphoribosylanthranilate isomerase
MVWIKICGITNMEDAEKISGLNTDAMGFILSTRSPRRINTSKAKKIIEAVRNKQNNEISMVGVFVNEEVSKVLKDFEYLKLDHIQLSGDEDGHYLKDLNERTTGVKIIKSIRIKGRSRSYEAELNEEIKKLKGHADFILLDSYIENIYGGTGMSFDWNIAKNCLRGIPIILSGGLDAENVRQAVSMVKPFGVDASSKLETYPGKKDIYKVSRFIDVLR